MSAWMEHQLREASELDETLNDAAGSDSGINSCLGKRPLCLADFLLIKKCFLVTRARGC